MLRGSLGDVAHVGATLPSGSDAQSFLWETVLTFFLMLVIMAVATDTRAVGEAAAIAIGGTVGLDAMFGGPISGASMNPARSLGPALVSGDLDALWIYLSAPLLGAAPAPQPTSSCAATSALETVQRTTQRSLTYVDESGILLIDDCRCVEV